MSIASMLRVVYDAAPEYVQRMLDSEYDKAVLSGIADVFVTVAEGVERVTRTLSILDAPDGAYATTTLRITPLTSLATEYTIKAGSTFSNTSGTRVFVLDNDTVIGDLLTSGESTATALGKGHSYNCKGQYTSLGGEVVPGTIDRVARLIMSPALGCDVSVEQITDATGGTDEALAMRGYDRGVRRYAGEDATSYRARASTIPDTVSPDAFERTVFRTLRPRFVRYAVTEGWQHPAMFLDDTDDDRHINALDDAQPGLGGLTSAELECTTIVHVKLTRPFADIGAPLDDVPADPVNDNVFSEGEYVASPCLDGEDPSNRVCVVLDGEDDGVVSILTSLADTLDSVRGGGTKVLVTGG